MLMSLASCIVAWHLAGTTGHPADIRVLVSATNAAQRGRISPSLPTFNTVFVSPNADETTRIAATAANNRVTKPATLLVRPVQNLAKSGAAIRNAVSNAMSHVRLVRSNTASRVAPMGHVPCLVLHHVTGFLAHGVVRREWIVAINAPQYAASPVPL